MNAAAATIAFATDDGVRTAYRKVGRGPLLLLIHGAEADHTMFLDLMDALADRFTVVAYDQRDSGLTDNDSASYGLTELAGDAAALIATLRQTCGETRVHVYGTSFGGQIAQVLASRYAGSIDRLVLGSTWRVGRPIATFNEAVWNELLRLRADPVKNAEAIARYFLTSTFLAQNPAVLVSFRENRRTDAQKRRRAQMMVSPPPEIEFSSINVPTLLMSGDQDLLVPTPVTFELAEHLRQTRCVVLEGLPHVVTMEAPRRVAHALREFLMDAAL